MYIPSCSLPLGFKETFTELTFVSKCHEAYNLGIPVHRT